MNDAGTPPTRKPRPGTVAYVDARLAEQGAKLDGAELSQLYARADSVAAYALGGRMDRDDRKQMRRVVEEHLAGHGDGDGAGQEART